MERLAGLVALVTGAGSGIGRASALRMADEGAAIMAVDIDEQAAQSTAALISEGGGQAAAMKVDVSQEDAVREALAATVRELGGIDVIMNNAGIGGSEWERTIAINLSGVYYGLLHGAPLLAERGGGSIINTASIAGMIGLVSVQLPQPANAAAAGGIDPNQRVGGYIAAKHGVVGLTKQFAILYGPRGVRVNAIAPGYIKTPMTAGTRSTPENVAFLESLHPIGRLGEPEEVAAAAAFLASNDASFITGITLPVDGGYTAR